MSLLEGHGDMVMNRAAEGHAAQASRFASVLQQRRQRSGAAKVVSSLVGLDAKLKQYEQGERFIEAVERAGGPDLFQRVWDGPEWLPTLAEIRHPGNWISRAEGLGRTA
jgi:putative hydrolase